MDKEKMEDIFKQIAIQEGISVEEVKSEIQNAISYAKKSSDEKANSLWEEMSHSYDSDGIEDIISFLVNKLISES